MFAAIGAFFASIFGGIGKFFGNWWSKLDGHDKVITVLSVILVISVSVQGYIISRNHAKIAQMEVQISQLELDKKLQGLQDQIGALDKEIKQRNENIAKIDERLGKIEKARKVPYAPKGMKVDEIVKGFESLSR